MAAIHIATLLVISTDLLRVAVRGYILFKFELITCQLMLISFSYSN